MGKKVFYGIENINQKLDSIINALDLQKYIFEVKLIISEAVMNAYIHGNGGDDSKPIHVEWNIKDDILCVQVKDSGIGKKQKIIKNHEDLLSESGRGLFIISAYTDEFYFKENSIVMKKSLS